MQLYDYLCHGLIHFHVMRGYSADFEETGKGNRDQVLCTVLVLGYSTIYYISNVTTWQLVSGY